MRIPKASKKVLTLLTVCFAFLLTFACSGGFAANLSAEKAMARRISRKAYTGVFLPGKR